MIWMDFIMLAFKKSDKYCLSLITIFIICNFLFHSAYIFAQSSEIRINNINIGISQPMIVMDADIAFDLSGETIEALNHGIPLEFDIKVRIKKDRDWIWDETILSKKITYRIEFQPLSEQYLVTEINSGETKQFQHLDGVLNYMGEVKNYPLISVDMITPDNRYTAQIKSQLNIQALPAPLRPLAYFSSQWHLSSPWLSRTIQI